MNRQVTFIVFCLLFWIQGPSQPSMVSSGLTEGSPESAGMSSSRIDQIDKLLKKSVEDGDIPGSVAIVVRNGKVVFHNSYGWAKAGNTSPLRTDHIFRIASQTKAITATAVMILWEEGHFRLDDPISRWIPEFAEPVVLDGFSYSDTTYTTRPASRQITIRDLLTHTSGIGYGVIDGDERFKLIYRKAGITDLYTTKNISIEENVKKLAALPLHHDPGESFTYSEGLDVLGYFVEIISGRPLDEFFKTRIFDPLGMEDTYFYLPVEKSDRLVDVQRVEDGSWHSFPVTFYDPNYPIVGSKRFFSGGAGLSSTAKDYATFLQMYLNKGKLNGRRILSRTTVDIIMANQIGDIWGADGDRHYGLAFGVVRENGSAKGGQGSKGTFEWGGYFNTQYFADPKEQVVGVLLKQTQGAPNDQTGWKFRQLVFAAIDD